MKNHEVQRLQTLGQLKNENIDFYGSKTYAVDSKGNQTKQCWKVTSFKAFMKRTLTNRMK